MVILRWFINAVALLLVSQLVPGFDVTSLFAALVAALILGLINVTIRPVLLLLTLPINVLTLGLFTFVINALVIQLTAMVVKGFNVADFKAAFFGALLLTIISWLVDHFVNSTLPAESVE